MLIMQFMLFTPLSVRLLVNNFYIHSYFVLYKCIITCEITLKILWVKVGVCLLIWVSRWLSLTFEKPYEIANTGVHSHTKSFKRFHCGVSIERNLVSVHFSVNGDTPFPHMNHPNNLVNILCYHLAISLFSISYSHTEYLCFWFTFY